MNEKKSVGFIEKLATFIVDKRNLFFLLSVSTVGQISDGAGGLKRGRYCRCNGYGK